MNNTTVNSRRRVLVSSFAISPYRGSEAGVGWNIVTRLAKYHDITVLYGDRGKQRNREDVERWVADHGAINGLTLCYVPPGVIDGFLYKLSYKLKPLCFMAYPAYRCWQKRAYSKAKELLSKETFDLVHQLNFVSYREPGYLWKLPIPFFWGPVAGAVNVPWNYFSLFGFNTKCRYAFRNLMNSWQHRGSGNILKAARKAVQIWAVTQDDVRMVEKWGCRADIMPETGTDPDKIQGRLRSFDTSRPLCIVWSGLHQGLKALPLLLHAVAMLNKPEGVQLKILGWGPETRRWQSLAVKLKVNHLIEWCGQMSLEAARRELDKGDVFVFTSIKEASSTVVMEALSAGIPAVCHDACGMSVVVDDTCGIKVPMIDPKTSIIGFMNAIDGFFSHPESIARLSSGALNKRNLLSWDAKAKRISEQYEKFACSK